MSGMFDQIGLKDEEKAAIKSMYLTLANYVDEYITYGSVDFEQLETVVNVLQRVRTPSYEANQDDLSDLWRVVQKAQRNHSGPKLSKEDRMTIWTVWKGLHSFNQRVNLFLDRKLKEQQNLQQQQNQEVKTSTSNPCETKEEDKMEDIPQDGYEVQEQHIVDFGDPNVDQSKSTEVPKADSEHSCNLSKSEFRRALLSMMQDVKNLAIDLGKEKKIMDQEAEINIMNSDTNSVASNDPPGSLHYSSPDLQEYQPDTVSETSERPSEIEHQLPSDTE